SVIARNSASRSPIDPEVCSGSYSILPSILRINGLSEGSAIGTSAESTIMITSVKYKRLPSTMILEIKMPIRHIATTTNVVRLKLGVIGTTMPAVIARSVNENVRFTISDTNKIVIDTDDAGAPPRLTILGRPIDTAPMPTTTMMTLYARLTRTSR